MRVLLEQSYGFHDIRVLNEQQATRQGILAAIDQLVVDSHRGDLVVFYYAGHGSQRLDTLSSKNHLDETIVPIDAWKGAEDIRDKELALRFDKIVYDTPAHLTAIYDSCNSGTMARGITNSVQRFLSYDDRDVAQEKKKDPTTVTELDLKQIPQKGDAIIIAAADPAIRQETSVTSEELAEWMKSVPALHQVMVLDTCNAGAAAEKLVEKREVPGDQARAIERLKDRTGLYVLMGAAADRPSYEASQFGQGLLTYALLKGMKGAALRDGEYVDVARLFQEASDDVPELAKNIGGIQQPRTATPGGASFDIGKLIAEDRQEIPLATVKPLLLRPLFLNAQMQPDNLGLSAALRKRLQEESFESAERRDGSPKTVYIDEDDFPGAISPSGDYTVTDKSVEVTVVLSKDGKDVAQFKIEGTMDDLPALTNWLADAIGNALPK